MSLELAVVMPIYNEEANIEAVISEWVTELEKLGIPFILFAVNDGSKDGTGAVLEKLAQRFHGVVRPIEKQNNGHGRACRTGYDLATKSNADWTLQIDSDGQCDPAFFASFWESRKDADVVFGIRKTRDDGFARVLVSTACWLLTSILCGIDLKDANVPYRLIKTPALRQALEKIPADFNVQNVALTLALKRNKSLRWEYVPIHFRDRQGGTNSINLKNIASMGWDMLVNLRRIGR
jgi:glycosyltransferase involved in cell wall biosynthesis